MIDAPNSVQHKQPLHRQHHVLKLVEVELKLGSSHIQTTVEPQKAEVRQIKRARRPVCPDALRVHEDGWMDGVQPQC